MQPFSYLAPSTAWLSAAAQATPCIDPALSPRRSRETAALIRQNVEQAQRLLRYLQSDDAGNRLAADQHQRFLACCQDVISGEFLPSPVDEGPLALPLREGHERTAQLDDGCLRMMVETLSKDAQAALEIGLEPLHRALKDLDAATEALGPGPRPVVADSARHFLDTLKPLDATSKVEHLYITPTKRYAAQLQLKLAKALDASRSLAALNGTFLQRTLACSMDTYNRFYAAFHEARRHLTRGDWDSFEKHHGVMREMSREGSLRVRKT